MNIPAHIEAGRGIPLVFLHGLGGGKEMWTTQLEHFAAQGYRAIAWDMPGYGASSAPDPFDFPTLANHLAAMLDHLKIERAILVGHSMGGMVALEFYARYAVRVSAMILSGSSPAFGKADGTWQRDFIAARLAPLDAGERMADLAPSLVANLVGSAADPAGVATCLAVMSRVPEATYRAAIRCLAAFDRRDVLEQIRVPCLALAGGADRTAPPAVVRRMAEKISGCVYREIAEAGHIANIERPHEFNAELRAFLAAYAPAQVVFIN
jgi:pimeloyl-ACP methyl ester carboxylesterase